MIVERTDIFTDEGTGKRENVEIEKQCIRKNGGRDKKTAAFLLYGIHYLQFTCYCHAVERL